MWLNRALQETGVHQEREPQLVGERQDHLGFPGSVLPGHGQREPLGGAGEQGFHPAQAGHRHQEWGEAEESREDSAE